MACIATSKLNEKRPRPFFMLPYSSVLLRRIRRDRSKSSNRSVVVYHMNIELKVGGLNILESIYILYTVLYAFDSYIFILPEPSVAIKIVTVALSIAGIVAMRHSLKQTDIKNSKKKVFNSTMITAVVMDCLVILSIVIHTPIREMGVL